MANRYLLGFDVGSSSVKASLVNADIGKCAATAFFPEKEAPIMAVKAGWAEQDPQMWWDNAKLSLKKIMAEANVTAEEIKAIGISYQMHGLVCVDKNLKALRPAIIWCDSRAVPYGEKAFKELGADQCLSHLLNSPGNFTAAKLAWVKENEPEVYGKIYKIMLPGDYIAMRLSGTANTTVSGLSEGMFWDFKNNQVADFLMKYYGFDGSLISDIVPTFSVQSEVCAEAAAELGLKAGTPITYRGGDQPNNALSLNVLNPGEIAATAGTSGATQSGVAQIAYHFEKPMIVTNVGGLPEIVPDGKVGYVVSPDSSALADGIARFFNPIESVDFSANIKEEKKKYQWNVLTGKIKKMIESISNGNEQN